MNNTTDQSTRVQAPANQDPDPFPVSQEIHDGGSGTPPGTVPPDRTGSRSINHNILKCKKPSTYSTFNVRTLNNTSKLHELVTTAKKCQIDIISIQEHRFYHPKADLDYLSHDNYQLVTASATKNSINSTIGGVGLLLSPRALNNLLKIEKISPRILVAEFNSSPVNTFIACYSPTNCSDEAEVDHFYSDLKSVTENIPAHNFVTVAGDFNAKLGPEDVKFTFSPTSSTDKPPPKTNRNGEKLLDYAEEFDLTISNTNFMKPPKKLWTFEAPNNNQYQLDYILVRKKWSNSIRDCQAYNTFATVGSDHRIVSATVCLSLRVSKRAKLNPMKQVDWQQVTADKSLTKDYTLAVKNRFDALKTSDDTTEEIYSKIITSVEEIALDSLPKKPKKKVTPLSSHHLVKEAREQLVHAQREYVSNHIIPIKRKVRKAQQFLDRAYATAEAEFVHSQVKSISKLHKEKKHSAAWKVVNEISGRKSKPSITIKGGSATNRLTNWVGHFEKLLGQPPPTTGGNPSLPFTKVSEPLDISTETFTLEELYVVLKSVKINKTPGLDNIPAIIWKEPSFHSTLLDICNDVFKNHTAPSPWLTSGILPFPKKGDLSCPSNYRGISLTALAAKIYNKLLLNRISPKVDPILRRNQNGFRKGRTTIAQVLSLRRIIEEMRNHNKEVTICFVDFKKAFDSINRDIMFQILPLYGIPEAVVQAVKALYTNTRAKVISPDGETDLFNISAGVLQGDTLAPFLFILVLDYALRISLDSLNSKGILLQNRRSSRNPAKYLTDLDFADDLALTSQTIADAEALLHSLESAAAAVGLICNESKTEFITTSLSEQSIKSLSGKEIKKVEDFKYLGSSIMNSDQDFKNRKGMAWSACNKLDKIWQSDMHNSIKIKLFRATVEPILLYGSETWTLTTKQMKRLDGTYTNLLMRVQNIHWKQHATLDQIYGNLPRVSNKLSQRRVQFAGHCFRAEDEVVSSLVLWKPPYPNRSNRLTYPDVISRDTGLKVEDLPAAMANRLVWKSLVYSIPAEVAG
jgi:exonuclease III|tara:strand:- start:11 stop:3097 length:3087 start_codon:yes stop_codon:yes gene_type:complete